MFFLQLLATALSKNFTLKSLNLESNFLTGEGIMVSYKNMCIYLFQSAQGRVHFCSVFKLINPDVIVDVLKHSWENHKLILKQNDFTLPFA